MADTSITEQAGEAKIVERYQTLKDILTAQNRSAEDMALLDKAYVFGKEAHKTQKRANGDPYFIHPIAVTVILANLKMDMATLVTALLHDTVEDTEVTLQDIEKLGGEEIRLLIDGVTKLTRLEWKSQHTKQAENLRKLVMAMSKDIRILLVKLADRMHNMQTLHFIPKLEKRQRIAQETIEIYAPLAERIGLQAFKTELQNISFHTLYPDAAQTIDDRLHVLREQDDDIIIKIKAALKEMLAEQGVNVEISGREKSPYSIWKKMQQKNISFDLLADVMAFRVIVDDVAECYQALGVVHSQYTIVPGRFKDYISMPKPNGYQSIHTIVIGPFGKRIEVQIRTQQMHEFAEYGVAAHWAYKQKFGENYLHEGSQYKWLRELLDIIENAENPEEFLEHTKMNMYQNQVFAFTPTGDLIALPRGASLIDFAYAIHSQVGDCCVAAKVNGKIQPLRSTLRNGDVVEVTTDKKATPSPDWEDFVITGKAKARIRRFIRQQQRQEYAVQGQSILQKYSQKIKKAYTEKQMDKIVGAFSSHNVEDIYAKVGEGEISPLDVMKKLFPEEDLLHKTDNTPSDEEEIKQRTVKKSGKHEVSLKGLVAGMPVHFARCCHPLPGDRIVGVITTGKGVTVHTTECPNLNSFADQPERFIDVGWNNEADDIHRGAFVGRIIVNLTNTLGSIASITTEIGRLEGDIHNMKITNRTSYFFEIYFDLGVRDTEHLAQIIGNLRSLENVNMVERT